MTEVTGMGIAAQWGEEEIVVYLPALQLDAGIQFAERLIQEIPAKTKPGVTVSGGMSSWTTTKPMAPLHYSNQPTKHSIQQKIRGKPAGHSSIMPIIFLNWALSLFLSYYNV